MNLKNLWPRKLRGPAIAPSAKSIYTAEMNRLMRDALMNKPIVGCGFRIDLARGPEKDDVAIRVKIINGSGEDLAQVAQALVKFDDYLTITGLDQPFNIKISQT